MFQALITLALLLLSSPAVAQEPTQATPTACPQFFPGGQAPSLANPRMERRITPLCNLGYAALASGLTRGPLWSAEHLTAPMIDAARHRRREGQFHPDERVPDDDRARLGDYVRSGYDRGHMVPSGDFATEAAQAESFALSNVVPQTAELNRGVWEGIESAVRNLAAREGELYVVTGPAFHGDALQAIGDGVLVPTSTWKAVYDPRANGAGVYVCKNTHVPTCNTVSVAALIHATGVDPFPALPDGIKQTAMRLPSPEDSPYAGSGRVRRHRERESLIEELLR